MAFKGHFKTYKRTPDAPSFSSPVTITAAILLANHSGAPSQIFPSDLGAATDCILSGAFPLGLTFNGFSSGLLYRFKNFDATTVIGTTSLTDHAIQNLNGSTNIELYSKNHDEPIIISAGSGMSGVAWRATSGGNRFKCVGLVIQNVGYAGFLRTTNTPASSYAVIDDSYCTVNGILSEGEGEYAGYNTTGQSPVLSFSSIHIIVRNKGREAWQVTHNDSAYGSNITAINVGQNGVDITQENLCQVHDSNGTLENFVFYNAPYPANIFAHGFTFRNGIFCWSAGRAFIGKASNFYAGSPRLNGVEVLFDNIEFLPLFAADYFCTYQETGCNIRFLNCTRPASMTGLVFDQRGASPPNSIIETNTTIATPSTPVFDARGRVADNHNYFLHRGGFTP